MGLADLPTVEEARALRPVKQKWEMTTRAEENAAKDRIDDNKLTAWRTKVYSLDKYRCRCCGQPVKRSLTRLPNRAEAHHVEPRENVETRYEVRNGLCLCHACHKRVTGMVADKLRVIGTKFFQIAGKRYINARAPVIFRKAV